MVAEVFAKDVVADFVAAEIAVDFVAADLLLVAQDGTPDFFALVEASKEQSIVT